MRLSQALTVSFRAHEQAQELRFFAPLRNAGRIKRAALRMTSYDARLQGEGAMNVSVNINMVTTAFELPGYRVVKNLGACARSDGAFEEHLRNDWRFA